MIIQDIEQYQPCNEQEIRDKTVILDFIQNNPDAFERSNLIAHVTASSWIVNADRSKVLMVYHKIYDSWSWTGGHADGVENLLDVALREAREETGIQHVHPVSENIYSIEVLTVEGHEKRGEYVPSHLHLNVTYLLEADEKDELKVCEDENTGVKWFSLKDALKSSTEPWFVKRIYSKLNQKLAMFPRKANHKVHRDKKQAVSGFHPFVKWAGGKNQLIDRLSERMPHQFNRYFEPFVGGGALFLHLKPQNAVINDVNSQLINIYEQLKNDSESVILAVQKLDKSPCDKAYYLKIRELYNQKILSEQLDAECAGMMIWLNKHCFNGLYRVNNRGLFNVPFNNNSGSTAMNIQNLCQIGDYLKNSNVQILHVDFEGACQSVQKGDFVYFDSPYIPLNATANFTDYSKDGFSMDDHQRLASLFKKLDERGALLLLSNHNVPLVRELYGDFQIEEFDVKRMINRDAAKRTGSEVIIRNY